MGAKIRLAELSDAKQLLAIYEPFVLHTPVSFETEVPAEAEFRSRIEQTLRHAPWLVCEVEGKPAGYAYAKPYRERRAYQWSVEATVYLAEGYWGRGLARGLYANLFACLRRQGFTNAYAGITLPNPASVKLHEAAGFRPIGVFGQVGFKLEAWHDVGWWELSLQPPPREPQDPKPLEAVLGEIQWEPPGAGPS